MKKKRISELAFGYVFVCVNLLPPPSETPVFVWVRLSSRLPESETPYSKIQICLANGHENAAFCVNVLFPAVGARSKPSFVYCWLFTMNFLRGEEMTIFSLPFRSFHPDCSCRTEQAWCWFWAGKLWGHGLSFVERDRWSLPSVRWTTYCKIEVFYADSPQCGFDDP